MEEPLPRRDAQGLIWIEFASCGRPADVATAMAAEVAAMQEAVRAVSGLLAGIESGLTLSENGEVLPWPLRFGHAPFDKHWAFVVLSKTSHVTQVVLCSHSKRFSSRRPQAQLKTVTGQRDDGYRTGM